jgi:Protein of unknown function, DUF488
LIFTGRYQDKQLNNEEYLLVRTTRGAPRFKTAYSLEANVPEFAPPSDLIGLETEEFFDAYIDHLDLAVNEVRVKAIFTDLKKQAKKRPIVLLCFCDLQTVKYCHRLVLAEFCKLVLKQDIPELSQDQFNLTEEDAEGDDADQEEGEED